LIYKRK